MRKLISLDTTEPRTVTGAPVVIDTQVVGLCILLTFRMIILDEHIGQKAPLERCHQDWVRYRAPRYFYSNNQL